MVSPPKKLTKPLATRKKKQAKSPKNSFGKFYKKVTKDWEVTWGADSRIYLNLEELRSAIHAGPESALAEVEEWLAANKPLGVELTWNSPCYDSNSVEIFLACHVPMSEAEKKRAREKDRKDRQRNKEKRAKERENARAQYEKLRTKYGFD